MRFRLLFLMTLLFVSNVDASNLKKEVNWAEVSSVPTINEADSVDEENNSEQNEPNIESNENILADLDFLKPEKDKRIFSDFEASFKILDKNTDRVSKHNIKFTNPVLKFKGYEIEVKSCANAEVLGVENDLAFIEVRKNNRSLFKGWMCNLNKSLSYPELRDLYITLQSCEHYTPPVADNTDSAVDNTELENEIVKKED